MRIIAGRLKGKIFDSPSQAVTHPMSEKMRGGLFNTLGDIKGLAIIDAFAGSGAIGFEALSRGARHVVAIENNRKVQAIILKNKQTLGLKAQYLLIKTNITMVASKLPREFSKADILVADPPYDRFDWNELFSLSGFIVESGILVISGPPSSENNFPKNFELIKSNTYGDGQLWFFRKN